MTEHDARLAALVADAVAEVEPRDTLNDLRERTRTTPPASRRPWLFATVGAVVATAAVITAIAMATSDSTTPRTDPGPATQAASPSAASPAPSPGTSSTSAASPADPVAAGVYYVGETARGPRLYREFHAVPGNTRLLSALEAMTRQPDDPDYTTYWPEGSFAGAGFDGIGADGTYSIALTDASLHDRPDSMTEAEARIAIQQAIYTVQAVGQTRAPVQFYLGHNPIDQVYGVPTSEALTNEPPLDVLSHVSLTSPTEGQQVSGTLEVEGVANSNEANIHWQLLAGGPAAEGSITADGYMGEKLFPFRDTIDVSGVPPGRYVFLVETDDPSGGAEGNGPDHDTRTIVIR